MDESNESCIGGGVRFGGQHMKKERLCALGSCGAGRTVTVGDGEHLQVPVVDPCIDRALFEPFWWPIDAVTVALL